MPRKIIRVGPVMDQTGLSRTQIWRKSRDPDDDFPEPVQLGPNSIGWFQDEISAYLESLPRGYLAQAPKLEEHQSGAKGGSEDSAAS